ncbi:T9SS type A sorting domain-containing protein [Algivirga pacifica]
MEKLPKGVYMLKIQHTQGSATSKVIVR